MVTQAPPRLFTAEDLLQLASDGFNGELIRGKLCEMPPPGIRHGAIQLAIGSLLFFFVGQRKLGTVVVESGALLERDPDTVRGPDVAFYTSDRMPLDADIPGYAEVAPNLVVEVGSPNDNAEALHDKAQMWLFNGVQMVWVVQPEFRSVDVYRTGANTVTITEPSELDGLDVLPGFSCSLEQIFGPAAPVDEPAAR